MAEYKVPKPDRYERYQFQRSSPSCKWYDGGIRRNLAFYGEGGTLSQVKYDSTLKNAVERAAKRKELKRLHSETGKKLKSMNRSFVEMMCLSDEQIKSHNRAHNELDYFSWLPSYEYEKHGWAILSRRLSEKGYEQLKDRYMPLEQKPHQIPKKAGIARHHGIPSVHEGLSPSLDSQTIHLNIGEDDVPTRVVEGGRLPSLDEIEESWR